MFCYSASINFCCMRVRCTFGKLRTCCLTCEHVDPQQFLSTHILTCFYAHAVQFDYMALLKTLLAASVVIVSAAAGIAFLLAHSSSPSTLRKVAQPATSGEFQANKNAIDATKTDAAGSTTSNRSLAQIQQSDTRILKTALSDFQWVSILALQGKGIIGKNNNELYIGDAQFPDVDPATLALAVGQNDFPIEYAKDKNHVYYISPYWDDKNQLVVNGVKIIPADSASFVPIYGVALKNTLSKTDIHGIVGAVNNFQCLYDSYGKDNTTVYFQDFPIVGADPKTFSIIFDDHGCPTNYDRDEGHIYYDNSGQKVTTTLSNVDAATFKVLDNSGYTEDKNHVYGPIGVPISDDPGSFVIVSPSQSCGPGCIYDAQDKSHKFLFGQGI